MKFKPMLTALWKMFCLTLSFQAVGNSPKILELYSGANHNCVLFDNKQIKCWGSNSSGRLGIGDSENRGSGPFQMGENLPYVHLGTDFEAAYLSLGSSFTCAVSDRNEVKCWGDNAEGQLGVDAPLEPIGDEPYELGGAIRAINLDSEIQENGNLIKIVTGGRHACALFASGRAKCWGSNSFGQLGIESRQPFLTKSQARYILLNTHLSDIVADEDSTCVIDIKNSLYCFGANRSGSLGTGAVYSVGLEEGDVTNLKPVQLGTDAKIVAVTSESHTCVTFATEIPRCFGSNLFGQLGIGTIKSVGNKINDMGENLKPILFKNFDANEIALNTGATCGLNTSSGSAFCWGRNAEGELGAGNTIQIGDSPVHLDKPLLPIDLGENEFVLKITKGRFYSCALLRGKVDFADKKVKCWGTAAFGVLGYENSRRLGDEHNEMGDLLPYVNL